MEPHAVEYRSIDISEIDLIRPLWEQLNEHHRQNAHEFRDHYSEWNFGDRKAYFTNLAKTGRILIDLAVNAETDDPIGYCVSFLSPDMQGAIESIFIREASRSQGIGTALMHRAIAWLSENSSVRIRVSVAAGNEAAFLFYRKFGFSPRMTILERKMS